jgi:hypothetical protein
MPLEVIGAGFGRTGTLSLKTALDQLGYPCYHMFEVIKHGDMDKWLDVVKCNNGQDYDFEKIFTPSDGRKPYIAAVDYPTSGYYKKLMELYPDAKVILTVRDSPEVWYQSASETIYVASDMLDKFLFRLLPSSKKMKQMGRATIWDNPLVFNGEFETRGKEIYSEWIEEVKRVVPQDKLLIFNVKQGWKPLCEFLGKPIPSGPFPRVNEREEFKKNAHSAIYLSMAFNGLIAAALIGIAAFAVKRFLK